jgi:hypothetical protein
VNTARHRAGLVPLEGEFAAVLQEEEGGVRTRAQRPLPPAEGEDVRTPDAAFQADADGRTGLRGFRHAAWKSVAVSTGTPLPGSRFTLHRAAP